MIGIQTEELFKRLKKKKKDMKIREEKNNKAHRKDEPMASNLINSIPEMKQRKGWQ